MDFNRFDYVFNLIKILDLDKHFAENSTYMICIIMLSFSENINDAIRFVSNKSELIV